MGFTMVSIKQTNFIFTAPATLFYSNNLSRNNMIPRIGNLITLFPFYSLPLIMITPLIFSLVSINNPYQNPYPHLL